MVVMTSYIQRRNRVWRPHYNVWDDTGFGFSVSRSGLATLLDNNANADAFKACVDAADRAFKERDRDAVIEWPTGVRHAAAPTPG